MWAIVHLGQITWTYCHLDEKDSRSIWPDFDSISWSNNWQACETSLLPKFVYHSDILTCFCWDDGHVLVQSLLYIFGSAEFHFKTFGQYWTTKKQSIRPAPRQSLVELGCVGFSSDVTPFRVLASSVQHARQKKEVISVFQKQVSLASCKVYCYSKRALCTVLHQVSDQPVNSSGLANFNDLCFWRAWCEATA